MFDAAVQPLKEPYRAAAATGGMLADHLCTLSNEVAPLSSV
jgi:hypothetical protein